MCTCGTMNRRHLLAWLSAGVATAALTGSLTACGGKSNGPAPVRWGKENCDYCGMIIDDPHFAGELRGSDGRKVWKFDDIGCAVLFLAKQPWANDAQVEFWAGDNENGTWIDGRRAWYAAGRKSPMSYDFGAVSTQREGALSFTAFQQAIAARGSTSNCEVPSQGSL